MSFKYNCEKLKSSAIKGSFQEATNQIAKEIKAVMNEGTGCDQGYISGGSGVHFLLCPTPTFGLC